MWYIHDRMRCIYLNLSYLDGLRTKMKFIYNILTNAKINLWVDLYGFHFNSMLSTADILSHILFPLNRPKWSCFVTYIFSYNFMIGIAIIFFLLWIMYWWCLGHPLLISWIILEKKSDYTYLVSDALYSLALVFIFCILQLKRWKQT